MTAATLLSFSCVLSFAGQPEEARGAQRRLRRSLRVLFAAAGRRSPGCRLDNFESCNDYSLLYKRSALINRPYTRRSQCGASSRISILEELAWVRWYRLQYAD